MQQQYVSVPANARAFFRMAEEGEPQMCPNFGGGDTVSREDVLGKLPEAAARFLLDMDRKLDAILGLLRREHLPEDFPLPGRVTELSGAGAVLECRQPLAPGDCLELVLLLEEHPLRMASAMARVEALAGRAPVTDRLASAFSLTFTRMREEDRETIIRFAFSEERRRIRLRKEEDDMRNGE